MTEQFASKSMVDSPSDSIGSMRDTRRQFCKWQAHMSGSADEGSAGGVEFFWLCDI
eukprot:SAG31_NODE_3558_length_4123_cov_4.557654_2_plen_56_part_00